MADEAARVAPELVVFETSRALADEPEGWQVRALSDGSRQSVYRRYFTATDLLAELGGGRALFDGDHFVLVSKGNTGGDWSGAEAATPRHGTFGRGDLLGYRSHFGEEAPVAAAVYAMTYAARCEHVLHPREDDVSGGFSEALRGREDDYLRSAVEDG